MNFNNMKHFEFISTAIPASAPKYAIVSLAQTLGKDVQEVIAQKPECYGMNHLPEHAGHEHAHINCVCKLKPVIVDQSTSESHDDGADLINE